MSNAFQLGGWGMYPTLVFGLFTIGVALWHAFRPDRRRVGLLVSLGLMTLISGTLGFVTGLIKTTTHLDGAPDKSIALIGLGESLVNVAFALCLIMVAVIAATVGTWRLSRATA
jgi:hypothetical protein